MALRAIGSWSRCRKSVDNFQSGIGLPALQMAHYRHAEEVIAAALQMLLHVHVKHPERFVSRRPAPAVLRKEVRTDPPKPPPADSEVIRRTISNAAGFCVSWRR